MSADDKTKLNGIAAGAEVNVQSDWNATSGDALILNKPTIPAAAANGTYTVKTLVGSTTTNVSDFTANQSSADDVTFVQGSNVTITPDATNRRITIASTDTDTKVTSVGNHYAPAATSTDTKSATASSTSELNWGSAVVTGVTLSGDAKGHITSVTVASGKLKTPVTGVTLASGTNNGTVKLTVNGSATDNIAVKGLGSMAYQATTSYSSATQVNTALASKAGTGITITAASGLTGGGNLSVNRTIGLATTGASGTYGPTADVTGTEGTTIKIPQITTDAYGRVTAVTERTLTNKNSTYTVNNGTFTVSGNGASVASTSANASANTGINIKAGSNVTITTGTSEITIAATDTKYTAATAAPGKVANASAQGSSTNYARQDHTHGIDLATGDSNGQVKIAGTNVSVKGLNSMAYQPTTSYSSATQVNTALSNKIDKTEYATFSAATNTSIEDLNGQSETIAAALNYLNSKGVVSAVTVSSNLNNVVCPNQILGNEMSGAQAAVVYVNSGTTTDYTITVSTTYKTPDGNQLNLTCPKNGYCEISYLNINGTIYARGI
jgi:hypothetical protein